MQFPNAYRGIRKIFTAEILTMISGIILVLTLIFFGDALSGIAAGDASAMTGEAFAFVYVGGFASLLAIAAFLL